MRRGALGEIAQIPNLWVMDESRHLLTCWTSISPFLPISPLVIAPPSSGTRSVKFHNHDDAEPTGFQLIKMSTVGITHSEMRFRPLSSGTLTVHIPKACRNGMFVVVPPARDIFSHSSLLIFNRSPQLSASTQKSMLLMTRKMPPALSTLGPR